MRRLIAITMLTGWLAAGAASPNAALAVTVPSLTDTQARAALVRHLASQYDVQNPTIACRRVSRVRERCQWQGLTPSDIVVGNDRSWSGYATVTRTARGITVLVAPLYWTGGLPPLPA